MSRGFFVAGWVAKSVPVGRVSRAAKGGDCKSPGYAFVGSSPTSPTKHLQDTDITTVFATVPPDCRTTAPHTGTDKSVISGCNRGENSRPDCHTCLPHLPATHRRKQRPTGLWLRGTVWQYRMRIPRDCVETVGREFVRRHIVSVWLESNPSDVFCQRHMVLRHEVSLRSAAHSGNTGE